MNVYSFAIFLHLLSLLLASTAVSLHTFASLRLRAASRAAEAIQWVTLAGRISRVFPIAVLGILATGSYMTQRRWLWSMPWIDAALAGLGLIVLLGAGVEASRTRKLGRELQLTAMTPQVRRLMRDPVAWTARMTGICLFIAVVFVMTVKPGAVLCAASIVLSVAAGGLCAVPMWRAPDARAPALLRHAPS